MARHGFLPLAVITAYFWCELGLVSQPVNFLSRVVCTGVWGHGQQGRRLVSDLCIICCHGNSARSEEALGLLVRVWAAARRQYQRATRHIVSGGRAVHIREQYLVWAASGKIGPPSCAFVDILDLEINLEIQFESLKILLTARLLVWSVSVQRFMFVCTPSPFDAILCCLSYRHWTLPPTNHCI